MDKEVNATKELLSLQLIKNITIAVDIFITVVYLTLSKSLEWTCSPYTIDSNRVMSSTGIVTIYTFRKKINDTAIFHCNKDQKNLYFKSMINLHLPPIPKVPI